MCHRHTNNTIRSYIVPDIARYNDFNTFSGVIKLLPQEGGWTLVNQPNQYSKTPLAYALSRYPFQKILELFSTDHALEIICSVDTDNSQCMIESAKKDYSFFLYLLKRVPKEQRAEFLLTHPRDMMDTTETLIGCLELTNKQLIEILQYLPEEQRLTLGILKISRYYNAQFANYLELMPADDRIKLIEAIQKNNREFLLTTAKTDPLQIVEMMKQLPASSFEAFKKMLTQQINTSTFLSRKPLRQ